MPGDTSIVVITANAKIITGVLPALAAQFDKVHVAKTAVDALDALSGCGPSDVILMDAELPGREENGQREELRARLSAGGFPVVLISEMPAEKWIGLLETGVIDDVVPPNLEAAHLIFRLRMAIRARQNAQKLKQLNEGKSKVLELDQLTGVFGREATIGVLFRETDRVQRMRGSLCLMVFDLDDFGHWNARLGIEECDKLLREVVGRTSRVLRSYDVLGRVGDDEFLAILPGCDDGNAAMLAERLRVDVFSVPFHTESGSIRLSACFGIAKSCGRSPLVVLREAEQALEWAKRSGAESIEFFCATPVPMAEPVKLISPTSGDELLVW